MICPVCKVYRMDPHCPMCGFAYEKVDPIKAAVLFVILVVLIIVLGQFK